MIINPSTAFAVPSAPNGCRYQPEAGVLLNSSTQSLNIHGAQKASLTSRPTISLRTLCVVRKLSPHTRASFIHETFLKYFH